MNFKEIGKQVEIFQPVSIISPETITIKERVRISEFTMIAGGMGTYIGNFIHIANHVSIVGGGICILEDFVGICAGTRIITGSEDISGSGIPSPMIPAKYRAHYRSYVVCKRHSFIGTNTIIHPGVTIGEGAVVASGSVVTGDVEPWSIYLGVPAKKVKMRHNATILEMEKEVYKECGLTMSDFSGIDYKHQKA